jgi:putative ABC transport system permease protein
MAEALNSFLINMIDIDVEQVVVPVNIRIFQFVSALLIPILASLIPILQGATLTVKDTLRNDGNIKGGVIGIFTFFTRLFIPSVLFQMAIRNIFLKPGRFFLTTVSLTLPGALFIASFGIETSLRTLDSTLSDSLFSYDIEFSFDGDVPIRLIEQIAEKQEGVLYVETWRQGQVHRVYGQPPPLQDGVNLPPPPNGGNGNRPPPPNGGNGNRPPPPLNAPISNSPSISGDILLRGVPIESRIIGFRSEQLLQGGWLQDSNDLLLTSEGYEALSIHVDGSRSITVGNSTTKEEHWDVAGVTGQMLISEGFVDINTFERFVPLQASSIRLAIVTESNNEAEIDQVLENLRYAYNQKRIDVNGSTSIRAFVERRGERLNIVTQTLITLSIMIGAVSVVGLISTISINVRERTKSIGILRSLGGDYRHLAAMVFIESLTIVLTSYILAFGLSFVVGNQMSQLLGNQIYSLDTSYGLVAYGAIVWFGIMILVGTISALGPALYAINITISDTLRYEG